MGAQGEQITHERGTGTAGTPSEEANRIYRAMAIPDVRVHRLP
ncbi:hypothetical protein [Glycomyces sp. L485]|nr:hypothetical protein [Glycomyces sp. L485]